MKSTSLALLGGAVLAMAQGPQCTSMPSCSICMSHNNLCTWCSVPVTNSDGTEGGNCYSNKDTTVTCSGVLNDSSQDHCVEGYTCSEEGDSCVLSGVPGAGDTAETCEGDCGAVEQLYKCNHDTATCDMCDEYEKWNCDTQDSGVCGDSCVTEETYSCNATTYTCEPDAYSYDDQSTCEETCGLKVPEPLMGSWVGTDVNADMNIVYQWSFDYLDGGIAYTTNGLDGTSLCNIYQKGHGNFDVHFMNGSLAGSVMKGYYQPSPSGPVTDAIMLAQAAPQCSGPPPAFPDAYYGGGVGLQFLQRVNTDHKKNSLRGSTEAVAKLTGVDATLTGTWKGLRIDENAEDGGCWAFTFNEDQTAVAYRNLYTNASYTASVTLSGETIALKDTTTGDVYSGIQLMGPGATGSRTRNLYLTIGEANGDAPDSFEDGLVSGTEWVLNGCSLEDPGYCDFSRVEQQV